MSIEQHIENIKREIDMEFDVFGFGLEVGLPKPEDYQDMPFKWWEGGYEMNTESLKKKLKNTNLVLGDVKETSKTFFDDYPDAAPIGPCLSGYHPHPLYVVCLLGLQARPAQAH